MGTAHSAENLPEVVTIESPCGSKITSNNWSKSAKTIEESFRIENSLMLHGKKARIG
ncbi:hypothetical protein HPP92_014436 [Vanilla planifolia]|uniref:Uncharacterized protein n=1 Tax=Vanilla planifolia TaxID=51239 RepID=A0A835QHD2_VANPL|nr:hypothetical protein HPP92_014436 [Vanilla planifolia]